MIRTALVLAIGASVAFAPAAFAAEEKVGGLPALSTKSIKELIEQREKWGDKPVKTYKD